MADVIAVSAGEAPEDDYYSDEEEPFSAPAAVEPPAQPEVVENTRAKKVVGPAPVISDSLRTSEVAHKIAGAYNTMQAHILGQTVRALRSVHASTNEIHSSVGRALVVSQQSSRQLVGCTEDLRNMTEMVSGMEDQFSFLSR
eukprot:TRINITY_DN7618_c0_g1_i3.p2 TRINITY_DN7618_c0_g1~~TRINITY_DN7618_c0_g1_i3.p2  ORF type:complete len:142 (-),score=32.98 TRINITY_DN7618_c0_g1_i3:467-892(-)